MPWIGRHSGKGLQGFLTVHKRVSTRILLLFTLCSLLPITALALFTLHHLVSRFDAQALDNLKEVSRTSANAAFERLIYLEGELHRVGIDMPVLERDLDSPLARSHLARLPMFFRSLVRMDPQGRIRFRWGEATAGSPLAGADERGPSPGGRPAHQTRIAGTDREHLAQGRCLLRCRGRHLYLHRLLEDRSLLVAGLNLDYLWGRNSFKPVRKGLFIYSTREKALIYGSQEMNAPLRAALEALVVDETSRGETLALAEEHLAFLRFTPIKRWFNDNLMVVIVQNKKEIGSVAARFKLVFLAILTVTFLAILLVGLRQTRRILNPVTRLSRALSAVEGNDFSRRVMITSGDEFEDLGKRFNRMVTHLELSERMQSHYENQLVSARDEALQAMQAESNFLSNVSHELRTPMTSIRSFAEILRDYADEDRETRGDFLDIIITESERLSRLIDDVLNLRRIQSGEERFRFEEVSIAETMEEVRRAVALGHQDGEARVELEVEPGLPATRADRDRLKQVWTNLLSNAIKFSPEGGVIHFRARSGVGEILVEVEDQGEGIPPEDREIIFERFRQATPNLLTDKPKGTGLGLAIAKDIVELHGGRITVEGGKGGGALFCVTIPLVGAGEAVVPADLAAAPGG